MKCPSKSFLVLCRRLWAAREARDAAFAAANPAEYFAALDRVEKLESLVLGAELERTAA